LLDDDQLDVPLIDFDELQRQLDSLEEGGRAIAGMPGPRSAADQQHSRPDLKITPVATADSGNLKRCKIDRFGFSRHDEPRTNA
jgi:hypothetical protein